MAQEVARVLPEAVRHGGPVDLADGTRLDDLLMVDRDRLAMAHLGATQELAKITVLEWNIILFSSFYRERKVIAWKIVIPFVNALYFSSLSPLFIFLVCL